MNGDSRLDEAAMVQMSVVCTPRFDSPEFSEMLTSDYGVFKPDDDEMAAAFWEEVKAIENAIDSCGLEVQLAKWQRSSPTAKNMYRALQRRGYAMQLWESYAIPLRFHRGRVVVLRAPDDVMGSPIVHAFPPSLFLSCWAREIAAEFGRLYEESARASRRARISTCASVAAITLCIALLIFFR